ncbi:MAG TPA: DUF3048 domain-containing protein, partial [Acidimicrobiia bacterium]|nr:DUF3048 domain-containing protein [Acidimicrobiia bacterium]
IRRAAFVAAVAASLLGAACGGGGEKDESASSTTQPEQSTTTGPVVAANANPLTGLPLDPALPARAALIVKIDNAPKARPQAGINQADVVVEEGVEGGVTRFATLFHSADAPSVGPVRSARSTDLLFARQVGRPLFSYSGANAVFAGLVAKAPLVDVGIGRFPGHYRREPGRPAPYNLFSETKSLFASAPAANTPPPPLFTYRAVGEAPPEAGSEPAPRVQAVWKLNITTTVVYGWDEASKTFKRSTDGAPHLDTAGVQVAPENVVFQLVGYRNTGLVDRSGAAVPEAELIGEGEAWVLTGGRLIKGQWSRPTEEQTTVYKLPSGEPIKLTPGRTWLELVPLGNLKAL